MPSTTVRDVHGDRGCDLHHTQTLGHCGMVDLAVDVVIGTPLDTVTMKVTAKDL